MPSAVEAIDLNWDKLLSGYEGEPRDRVADVLKRLRENLVRLQWRYEECKSVDAAIRQLGTPGYSGPTLHELQLRLVDKVEAFHQHIYATLAVLALALNHLKDKRSTQSYPVGSISKFLTALRERDFRYRDRYLDHVSVLERSADFRSKYVDHPERHQLHDWMSYGLDGEYYIIYFIRKSDQVFFRGGPLDPFSPDFQPPVDCGDDFYVAPDIDKTYDAMQRVVIAALGLKG